jgi:hypothetical protein
MNAQKLAKAAFPLVIAEAEICSIMGKRLHWRVVE